MSRYSAYDQLTTTMMKIRKQIYNYLGRYMWVRGNCYYKDFSLICKFYGSTRFQLISDDCTAKEAED